MMHIEFILGIFFFSLNLLLSVVKNLLIIWKNTYIEKVHAVHYFFKCVNNIYTHTPA